MPVKRRIVLTVFKHTTVDGESACPVTSNGVNQALPGNLLMN
jgi:hypothetical protein